MCRVSHVVRIGWHMTQFWYTLSWLDPSLKIGMMYESHLKVQFIKLWEKMFHVQMRPLWTWEVLAIHKLSRGRTTSPSSHRTLSRDVCATCPSSKWWGFSLAWTNSGRNLWKREGCRSNTETAITSNHLLRSSCMKWHSRKISYSKHIRWSTRVSVGSKRLICGFVNRDM